MLIKYKIWGKLLMISADDAVIAKIHDQFKLV